MEKTITRRDFLKKTTVIAVGAAAGVNIEPETKSKVVLVRDKDVFKADRKVDPDVIQDMLDRAVVALTGKGDAVAAFKSFIAPDDIVGIKSNAWRYIPTPVELEKAIEQRVLDAGVNKKMISIDDRGVLRNPVFRKATAIINTRPVRTHYWAGIGGCIKNVIMFSPTPPKYHPDSCADLAKVWQLPAVKDKVRLNILSALTPLYHGRGPHHYDKRYVWNYNGIIVGTDPVSVDAVGLALIMAKRKEHFGRDVQLHTVPKHIRMADKRHHLGVSDQDRIEFIKLGWDEGCLI